MSSRKRWCEWLQLTRRGNGCQKSVVFQIWTVRHDAETVVPVSKRIMIAKLKGTGIRGFKVVAPLSHWCTSPPAWYTFVKAGSGKGSSRAVPIGLDRERLAPTNQSVAQGCPRRAKISPEKFLSAAAKTRLVANEDPRRTPAHAVDDDKMIAGVANLPTDARDDGKAGADRCTHLGKGQVVMHGHPNTMAAKGTDDPRIGGAVERRIASPVKAAKAGSGMEGFHHRPSRRGPAGVTVELGVSGYGELVFAGMAQVM